MELNPTSMDPSLPLDLPLPNLPMVKEESETDASNSLIKEEKAVSLIIFPNSMEKYRCHILVTFPSYLKKLHSI